MSPDTDRWNEFLRAKAEAHRLQAEQYAAEERAYLLNPIHHTSAQEGTQA